MFSNLRTGYVLVFHEFMPYSAYIEMLIFLLLNEPTVSVTFDIIYYTSNTRSLQELEFSDNKH